MQCVVQTRQAALEAEIAALVTLRNQSVLPRLLSAVLPQLPLLPLTWALARPLHRGRGRSLGSSRPVQTIDLPLLLEERGSAAGGKHLRGRRVVASSPRGF